MNDRSLHTINASPQFDQRGIEVLRVSSDTVEASAIGFSRAAWVEECVEGVGLVTCTLPGRDHAAGGRKTKWFHHDIVDDSYRET